MEYVVETEKEIVQNYIIKSKQERIEWELNHPQKRKDIIWHFHKPDIFKEACLHPVDYMDQEAMKNYLHKLSSAENVYFIGEDYTQTTAVVARQTAMRMAVSLRIPEST